MAKKIKLVDNWWSVFWKSWANRVAALALFLPDLLQWALENMDMLSTFGKLDDAQKNHLRLFIIAAIPVARVLFQKNMPDKNPQPERMTS